MADDAGALLVRAGLITAHHLASARAVQAQEGGTIGEHLVVNGIVSDDALTEFYRSRLLVPQVNPNTLARLSASIIAVLPSDMALEFRAVPVSLDSDGNLMVAMSDPSDRHAVDEIAFFTSKYVVRAVATQMQIAWCLAQYYGYVTELGEKLLQPVAGGPSAPTASAPPPPAPAPAPAPAATPQASRVRGDTARVDAARHRVLAPVTTPPPVGPRPGPEALLRADAGRVAAIAAEADTGPSALEITVDDPSGPVRQPPPAGVALAIAAGAKPGPAMLKPLAPLPASPAATPPAAKAPAPAPALPAKPPAPAPAPAAAPPTAASVVVSAEANQPKRKRPALPDPPELAARSGEMEVHIDDRRIDAPSSTIEIHLDDEPALRAIVPARAASPPPVVVEVDGESSRPRPLADRRDFLDDDEDTGESVAYVHDEVDGSESSPILLETPRRSDIIAVATPAAPAAAAPAPAAATASGPADEVGDGVVESKRARDESGPVLLLDRKKSPSDPPHPLPGPQGRRRGGTGRPQRHTVIGIGALGTAIPIPRSPGASIPPPSAGEPAPAAARAVARAPSADDDDEVAHVSSPAPPADAIPTAVVDEQAATRRVDTRPPSMIDDGWGPPGTTIPPPFLGAVTPAPSEDQQSGRIPVAGFDADSAPLLLVGPTPSPSPVPAIAAATGPTRPRPLSQLPDAAELARQLEAASIRLVELLRRLDHTDTRDHALNSLLEFVTASHHRAAFLAAKGGVLTAFLQVPSAQGPHAEMRLDEPSTFQDVVGTRLPYRGPIADAPSRELVKAMFGSTTDEMLAVPVAIRERVIGVIYADGRHRHAFDEHVTVAARAAGLALERILKASKKA